MGRILLVASLLLLLAGSLYFAIHTWFAFEVGEVPAMYYVILAFGILFSLLVGCGLMALMFYSSRHGYDEAAQGREADQA